MGALLAGSEFVVGDPFDPDVFWDRVRMHDATILLYLGRMLSVLSNQAASDGEANPVEMAIGHGFGFGTDKALIETVETQFGLTVLEGYGVTQTATVATYNTPEEQKIGSVGKPGSYVEVAIVDDADRPVPTGESGEIVIRPTRPNTMMQGYANDPEAAMEVCRNQWIHTGDIGYMDDDGYLHFVASEDNSIYRGRIAGRISALEIESVINRQPGVARSAVVGVEGTRGGEEIKAVVVPETHATVNPVDICRHCERQLPYLKVPRYIEVREELPLGPSGSVQKKPLEEQPVSTAWDRESGYELSR
jgi:acyl-CoA synthetase (AMP-forming)/AMP-acid ligase II